VPLAVNLLDPHSVLSSLGALGVFVILFAETGLLIGFFLPGDSLLFTAGLLCTTKAHSTIHLSLPAVLAAPARTFTIWQIAGGLVWSVGVTLAGYTVGSHISNVDRYLLPIIAVVVVLSLIPVAVELRRHARANTGGRR